MAGIWKLAGTVQTVLGVLSVLVLIEHAIVINWFEPIRVGIRYYEVLRNWVLDPVAIPVRALLHRLGAWFDLQVFLSPRWKDIFVLLAVYLGARARSYWSSGLRKRAVFRLVWGGLVAVICGVLVGICRVEGRIGNTLMVAAVVASLAIYDVIDSSWSASFYRKGGLSWGQDFLRYQAYAAPTYLLGGVIVLAFYGIWTLYADRGFFLVPGLVAIILYMVFLAIYWAIRGIESSLDWDRPGTPLQRFLASSNTRIAMSMLQILGAAIVVAAISLGLPSP